MYQAKQAGDRAVQIFLTVVGLFIASLPTDFFLLVRYAFEPQGFWQNIVLAWFGIYFFGAAQLVLLVALAIWLFVVWFDD